MTNDAMTKADAARERRVRIMKAAHEAYCPEPWRCGPDAWFNDGLGEMIALELSLHGDQRAVEAEIAALRRCFDSAAGAPEYTVYATWLEGAMADAEQREKELP